MVGFSASATAATVSETAHARPRSRIRFLLTKFSIPGQEQGLSPAAAD